MPAPECPYTTYAQESALPYTSRVGAERGERRVVRDGRRWTPRAGQATSNPRICGRLGRASIEQARTGAAREIGVGVMTFRSSKAFSTREGFGGVEKTEHSDDTFCTRIVAYLYISCTPTFVSSKSKTTEENRQQFRDRSLR